MLIICHINLSKVYRGGERQTEILIKELSKKNFCQKVYIRKNSILKKKLESISNLTIIELNKPFIFNIFKFKQCEVIHAHEKKGEQLAFFIYKIYKIPYFITRRINKVPKKTFFNNLIYGNAKKVFVLTTLMDKLLKKSFLLNTQVISDVSSNLETTENLFRLKEKYKNQFIITNIGALVNKDKGQEYIIKAAALLKNYKNIKFLIVGEGEDRDFYEKLINKYSLNNIELVGFKKNVGDYLQISDIFLFPSLNEGLGSILIDAMEFSKPIIATNIGGIPDLIKNNYNGLLIPSRDEIAIKDAIEKLYKDNDLRVKLANSAKEESKKYQIENLIDFYIQNYKSAIKDNKSRK